MSLSNGVGLIMALVASSTASHARQAPSFTRQSFELGPLGYRVGVIKLVDLNQDGLDDVVVMDDPSQNIHVYMAGARHGHVQFHHCGPLPVPGGRDFVGYDLDPFDGLTDLVLAVESGPYGGIYVYEALGLVRDAYGRPTPTFAAPVQHAGEHRMHMPSALAVGNLNQDQGHGRALDDLIIGQTNHEVGVGLYARGACVPHTFLPFVGYAQQYFPRKLAVGDFDADGFNDIIFAGGTQSILPGIGVSWNEGNQAHVVSNHPHQLGANIGFFAPTFTPGERLRFYNGTSSIHQHALCSDFAVVDVDGDLRQDIVFSTHLVSGNPSTALPIQIFMNNGSRNVDPFTGAFYYEYGVPGAYLLAALREPSEFAYVNRSLVPAELGYVRRALAPADDEVIDRGPSARPILELLAGECDGRPGTDLVTVTGDLLGAQQFIEFYARR